MKTKRLLIKLINNGKTGLSLYTNGYVFDCLNQHKLFVLKKEPIQLIQNMMENYQKPESIATDVTQVVKYNGINSFETRDYELMRELLRIIYCPNNIKFMRPDFVEVLDLIQANLAAEEN